MTQAELWMVGAERYFLLLAPQLRKCVVLLPGNNLPKPREQKNIRLLRNSDEHWENPQGDSIAELHRTRPDVGSGQIISTGKHTFIDHVSTA